MWQVGKRLNRIADTTFTICTNQTFIGLNRPSSEASGFLWPLLVSEHHTPGEEGPSSSPLSEEVEADWTQPLTNFYGATERISWLGVTARSSSCTAQHENDWTQVVRTAQGALGYRLPDLDSVHATCVHKKARRIATDPTYPATHCLYRFHQESSRSRLRDSFFHRAGKAIALLRWDAHIPTPCRTLTHASPPFPRSYRRMSSLSLALTHTETFHWLALSALYLLYFLFYIYILPLNFHLSMLVLFMCVF